MGANLLSVVWRKGLTADEFYHVPAGYYHLTAGEFRINTEHPPLVKMLSAVPLLGVPVPQRLKVLKYRRRTPEAVFGNSIYLYRVKE
jgi:hypothetical protein